MLLIVLTGLGALAMAVVVPGALKIAFLLYGLITAVSIYVMFGWLEHTLRLLIGIAFNTAASANLIGDDGEDED